MASALRLLPFRNAISVLHSRHSLQVNIPSGCDRLHLCEGVWTIIELQVEYLRLLYLLHFCQSVLQWASIMEIVHLNSFVYRITALDLTPAVEK